MLASVVLRLLGCRVIHEDADLCNPTSATADLGESLYDRLLLVLHALLSTSNPYWLRSKFSSKSTPEGSKDSSPYDREVAESLQVCIL